MTTNRIVVYAPNIRDGGGRVLLLKVLEAMNNLPSRITVEAIIDSALDMSSCSLRKINFSRIKSTTLSRLKEEYALSRLKDSSTLLLCFSNLPPLFTSRVPTAIFIQNFYLTGPVRSIGGSRLLKIKSAALRLFIRLRVKAEYRIIVQSESMRRRLDSEYGISSDVLAFASTPVKERPNSSQKKYDFVYVASGYGHKNHVHLIQAWILLSKMGHKFSLALTLDVNTDANLVDWVELMSRRHNLSVVNLGRLNSDEIEDLYINSDALIYPSYFESFGLPIVEAKNLGLPILASERDYVRDLVEPTETFDPGSSISIARSVLRYREINYPKTTIASADEFISALLRV